MELFMRDKRHTSMRFSPLAVVALPFVLAACGGATPPPNVGPGPTSRAQNQIISEKAEGTPAELFARGERLMLGQDWQGAVDTFETLLAAEPEAANAPTILFNLGVSYEGLQEREKARDRFRTLVTKFPSDANVRNALVREAGLDAYLEDWAALGEVAKQILERKDLNDVDRMTALGARALSRIELGDLPGASKDVQDGLDLVDTLHYGATGRLPVAAAQLKFAHGEVRRVRSEQISLLPVTPDFLMKIEMRCQGLLDAQNAFADAIRSIDPHWAAMSGYRVGDMYRTLHKELMQIPPQNAKNDNDRQLFFAMMHLRYRVLLEKGLEMMNRTIALAEKTQDSSGWAKRAVQAKADIEDALDIERSEFKKFPFSEATVQEALDILKRKANEKAAKEIEKAVKNTEKAEKAEAAKKK